MFRHIIYAIFLQLVNKTTDCFNNIAFILMAKISSKKVCEKMENNSKFGKVLLVFNRNAELLRFSQKDDEKFDNSVKFAEKKMVLFVHCC